jgi:hypothetical protein
VNLDRVNGTFPYNSTDIYLKWADGHPIDNPNFCVAWSNATLKTISCGDKYQPMCET